MITYNRSFKYILMFLFFVFPNSGLAKADPPINGTFIQPLEVHKSWNENKWNELFDYYENLGINKLVIQWTQYNNIDFYNGVNKKKSSVLKIIMNQAEKRNMEVYVGLYNDSDYWKRIRNNSYLTDVYMQKLKVKSESLVKNLLPLVNGYKSFAGWYIPQEVDDVNWINDQKRKTFLDYLKEITIYLRTITKKKHIAVSGFSNAYTDPATFALFWNELIGYTHIDTVMFQDSIGTHKLNFNSLPIYLSCLEEVTRMNSCSLYVVAELFTQRSVESGDGQFAAEPADLERISRQLQISENYSHKGVIAFSVMEYMTPMGGENADQLYKKYIKRYIKNS